MNLIFATLLVGILAFGWMMYSFNRKRGNDYNIVDILMGPNNRASLTNHILLAMAGMSIWVIVIRTSHDLDVTELVLGTLGIFVLQKTATSVTDIINKPKPDDPPPKEKEKT